MNWKRRLGEAYIKYKIRVGRGSSFTAEIEGVQNAFQKGVLLFLLLKHTPVSYLHYGYYLYYG